jgi:hypothetical protein
VGSTQWHDMAWHGMAMENPALYNRTLKHLLAAARVSKRTLEWRSPSQNTLIARSASLWTLTAILRA